MNKQDKIHKEALTAMVINALEFNAVVVSYATQVLANTGGEAVKRSSAKRISADFQKMAKAYTDKYQDIVKDIETKAGLKNE
jgi:hypothetical protein